MWIKKKKTALGPKDALIRNPQGNDTTTNAWVLQRVSVMTLVDLKEGSYKYLQVKFRMSLWIGADFWNCNPTTKIFE